MFWRDTAPGLMAIGLSKSAYWLSASRSTTQGLWVANLGSWPSSLGEWASLPVWCPANERCRLAIDRSQNSADQPKRNLLRSGCFVMPTYVGELSTLTMYSFGLREVAI